MTRKHRKPVLVIEDDADIRNSLMELLEMEGYEVRSAVNGKEGLERLQEISEPCLVLLDLYMPVMDGAGFLKKTEATPCLFEAGD